MHSHFIDVFYPPDRFRQAHGVCNIHDTAPREDDHSSRWPKDCEDDRSRLPSRDSAHRFLLQLEFDLWKSGLFILECIFYPDAQGKMMLQQVTRTPN